MTNKLFRLAAAMLFLSLIPVAVFAKDAPTSAEQLRSELELAIKAKDTNAIISLFNLEDVSARMKSQPVMVAAAMIYDGVASVKILPLTAGLELTNEVNGVRYYPNVRVIGVIEVAGTKPGSGTKLPYGERAGKFYLPGIMEETINANAPKEKSLGIILASLSSKDPNTINGSYVYLKDGKEITRNVCFTNTMSYMFWGDNIKSCQVNQRFQRWFHATDSQRTWQRHF